MKHKTFNNEIKTNKKYLFFFGNWNKNLINLILLLILKSIYYSFYDKIIKCYYGSETFNYIKSVVKFYSLKFWIFFWLILWDVRGLVCLFGSIWFVFCKFNYDFDFFKIRSRLKKIILFLFFSLLLFWFWEKKFVSDWIKSLIKSIIQPHNLVK